MADVWHRFAENLVGERGGVAFAKEEKAKNVCHRIAFGPFEINMRDAASELLDVNEEGCDGVRDHWTARIQDAMAAESRSFYFQVLVEL